MKELVPLNRENSPSPQQLSKLASAAMSTASKLNKIRQIRMRERANSFINENDYIYADDENIITNNHRMSFRVARRVQEIPTGDGISTYKAPLPEWNMQIFDTHWFNSDSPESIGIRSLYYFAWNNKDTYRADKKTRAVPYNMEYESIENMLHRIQNSTIDPDVLHVENEYRIVNSDDFEYLSEELQEYFDFITRPQML